MYATLRASSTACILTRRGLLCSVRHRRASIGVCHAHRCQGWSLVKKRRHVQPRLLNLRLAAGPSIMSEVLSSAAPSSFTNLIVTCLVMFAGAYTCGILPSLVPLQPSKLDAVTAAGAGLLLGSALCVIIPEGFEAMHEAAEDGASLPHWTGGTALLLGFWVMLILEKLSHQYSHQHHQHQHTSGKDSNTSSCSGAVEHHVVNFTSSSGSGFTGSQTPRGIPSSGLAADVELSGSGSQRSQPGLSDEEQRLLPNSSSLMRLKSHDVLAKWSRADAAALQQQRGQQVLLGLIIHAAADGLAVGAAALSPQPAVSVAVGVAMVVHKGPVALGLTSCLSAAAWSSTAVQKGLLLFSATSPAAALATYLLALSLPSSWHSPGALALAVLLSGGSVLYAAACHVLPGVLEASSSRGEGGGSGGKQQLLWLSLGMLVPLLLSVVVQHQHGHHGHLDL